MGAETSGQPYPLELNPGKRKLSEGEYQGFLEENGLSQAAVDQLKMDGKHDELVRKLKDLGINCDPNFTLGKTDRNNRQAA